MDRNKKTFLKKLTDRIVKFFTTNVVLKVFALTLTGLVFVLAPRDEPEEKKFSKVPVRIQVSEKNIVVHDKDAFVRVVLKGRKIDPNLTDADLTLELNAKNAVRSEDGKQYTWNLKTDDVKVPWGVRCESILPSILVLEADTLEKRQVDVEAVFADGLPEHLARGKVTVTPAKVTLVGPSSRLQTIKSIRTVPIEMRGISRSFDCDQNLEQSSTYAGLQFSPSKVMVQVEIMPASFQRVFRKIPIRILTAGDAKGKKKFSCRILSSPEVDLTLTGRKDVIESLRKEDFFPFVDISGFARQGRYEMDVRCAFELSNIHVKKFSPRRVSILLTEIPEKNSP